MGHSKQVSLNFQLRTIKAKNIDFLSTRNLFVRYHLPLGNGQRIQLNTKELSSKSELHWNETFSLDCHGNQESMHRLEQENLVLELRWRHTTSVLRKLSRSQLLGRAEIPWKIIIESPNMEMEEKLVTLVSTCSLVPKDVKPPVILQVAMKMKIPDIVGITRKKKKEAKMDKKWDECGCKNIGCSCSGYEMFALGSAIEGL